MRAITKANVWDDIPKWFFLSDNIDGATATKSMTAESLIRRSRDLFISIAGQKPREPGDAAILHTIEMCFLHLASVSRTMKTKSADSVAHLEQFLAEFGALVTLIGDNAYETGWQRAFFLWNREVNGKGRLPDDAIKALRSRIRSQFLPFKRRAKQMTRTLPFTKRQAYESIDEILMKRPRLSRIAAVRHYAMNHRLTESSETKLYHAYMKFKRRQQP
jgi:hypothetical protein